MYLKQNGTISSLRGKPRKWKHLVHTHPESDVNIRLVMAWIAINRLVIIWKSDISDKIKRDFLQTVAVSIWIHHVDANKTLWEKAKQELHENSARCFVLSRDKQPRKQRLYSHLLPFSQSIRVRRTICRALPHEIRRFLIDSCTWMCQCWPTCKD